MAWKNESRRHSLARKGVKTAQQNQMISKPESSGIWFESHGIIGEMVSLINLFGFNDLMETKQSKGIKRDQYETDASQIMLFPSTETARSIDWMYDEYLQGNNRRKQEIRRMVDISVKQIESRIRNANIDARMDLHKSRRMLMDFKRELYRGYN